MNKFTVLQFFTAAALFSTHTGTWSGPLALLTSELCNIFSIPAVLKRISGMSGTVLLPYILQLYCSYAWCSHVGCMWYHQFRLKTHATHNDLTLPSWHPYEPHNGCSRNFGFFMASVRRATHGRCMAALASIQFWPGHAARVQPMCGLLF